jgi:hypothetical protein
MHAFVSAPKKDANRYTFLCASRNADRYLIAGYVMMVAIVLDKAPRRKAVKADNTTGEESPLAEVLCLCSLKIRPFSCS